MFIPLNSASWMQKNQPHGTEFVTAYKNGQLAVSVEVLRSLGLDGRDTNRFRAGRTPNGDLVLQFIPQSEHNPDRGATWSMSGSVSSFNVITQMGAGWEGGRRYKFDVDPDQKAIIIYKGTAYDYKPRS